MKVCSKCGLEKPKEKFPKGRSKCYSCQYKDAGGSKHNPEYSHKYYEAHKLVAKYKAYSHRDKVKEYPSTLTRDEAIELMLQPCFYCGEAVSQGLDRIHNNQGHSLHNVRPCCEKCNNILGDLPDEAKLILKDSLTEIKKKGILEEWTIPTKRIK